MMKNTLLIIVALLSATLCFAQKDQLVMSEQNKYTYFQVKPLKYAVDAADLAKYLKSSNTGIKTAKAVDKGVSATGELPLFKKGLITSQEEAALSYDLSIDFKEDKYRLLLTNFIYTPYQRNRYGVFAAVDGAGTSLEGMKSKLTAKQFDDLLANITNYSAKVNKVVNDRVNNAPKPTGKAKADSIKKVNTKEW